MLKRSLYALTLGLMLCINDVQAEVNCLELCRAAGMACMRACTSTFPDKKKCEEICEYTDDSCRQPCSEMICKEECNKKQNTSADIESCINGCGQSDKGRLEKWIEKPLGK